MTERLVRASYHEAGHCAAALTFGIPVIRVTIDAAVPHVLRGRYRPPPGLAFESLVTMCLSGPAAEDFFCGAANDGSAEIDYADGARLSGDRLRSVDGRS